LRRHIRLTKKGTLIMRAFGLGPATLAMGLLLVGTSVVARADDTPVPEQIVDGMNKVWGSHPGLRANHAKGVVAEGSFTPGAGAAALSKAVIFSGKPVPVTVRFSDATGVPNLPDGDPYANPHGFAIKFHLADGGEADIVSNSLKFFPVATGEEFRDLLNAIIASGPDSPKPTKLEQFIGSHPAFLAANATVATPTSFARETYYGIDAFVFVNAAGARQPFRWKILPAAGAEHLSSADAAKQSPDFLVKELPARLAKGPVVFSLSAQLANPGDPTSDPTKPWPDDRKVVELGTLTLTKAAADSATAEKSLLFLPTNLPDGIEASDDPLIDTRTQAYAVSFGRRSQ
jgi:catalase